MTGNRRRIMVWIGVLLLIYTTLVVSVYLVQDALVFPGAARGRGAPVDQIEGVRVEWVEGPTRYRVAVAEVAEPAAVVLQFVGNGEDLRSGVYIASALSSFGVTAIVTEYPGYGDSEGSASAASLLAAADHAGEFAVRRARESGVPLVVAGMSLGTCSAVHLARQGVGDRLLLVAPPTSIAEVGASRFWFLPVRWLLRHDLDNLRDAARVQCPALVVHGDADVVVPVDYGRRVAAALQAELLVVRGGGHSWLIAPSGPVSRQVREFLRGR